MMFTVETYKNELERLLAKPLVPCQFWSFDARDIGPEQTIRAARCRKSDFESSLHFFINALRFYEAEEISPPESSPPAPDGETFVRYGKTEKISPMSADDFYEFIARRAECMKCSPAFTPARGEHFDKFIDAVYLDVSWDEQTAVEEFDLQFIAFFWSTSG